MALLPENYAPCQPCQPTCATGALSGPQGDAGAAGVAGVGINAFTLTNAAFTVPAVNGNVTVVVLQSAWMVAGQDVYVGSAGYYQVASIVDSTDVVLTNLGTAGNAVPTTVIASAQGVSPAGVPGATGSTGGGVTSVGLSVPAGFLVTGSPVTGASTLAITTDPATLQNRILASPDGVAGAAVFRALVAADIPNISAAYQLNDQLPIANGGTGQASASAGFNALAPPTTKGDIIVRGVSDNVRLAIGTNGQVLTADSAQTNGLAWETPASVLTNPNHQVTGTTYTMSASDLMIGVNRAGAVNIILPTAPADGRLAIIKDRSGAASSNTITVSAAGGDTIQGSATKTITTNYGYLSLYYDHADAVWYTIGSA